MRGYELADKLDVEFGELSDRAEELGVELGHHMSDVDEDIIDELIELFDEDPEDILAEESGKKEDEESDTQTDETDEQDQELDSEEQSETTSEEISESSDEDKEATQEETQQDEEESSSQKRMRKADLDRERDAGGSGGGTTQSTQTRQPEADEADEDVVELALPMTLRDVSEELGIPSNDLIMTFMQAGVQKTINDQVNVDDLELLEGTIDQTIEIVEDTDLEDEVIEELETDDEDEENLEPRAPVVTVLGHVDHGKTSILDRIRETHVAEGEAGGITQQVGASRIEHEGEKIVFIDTPGHEAFTEMRARGANTTDLAILVVAADDGVMPQTKESVNHARAADVPMVVAINKIDKPNADATRARQEVSELELIPEEWGGETVFVNTSAETGEGIDELLQMITLESELLGLQANPNKDARGACLESKLIENQGVTSTLLVQEGTLKPGDVVLCGSTYGKVRALFDDHGNEIDEAGPSTPAVVLGLNETPEAGEPFYVVEDEQTAQEIVEDRQDQERQESLQEQSSQQRAKLAKILEGDPDEEKFVELVVKAGSEGAGEVLVNSLQDMEKEKASVNILHHGVGNITESDIILAEASNAIVIGFQTGVTARARDLADRKDIEIRTYDVIYNLLEEMEKALLGVLEPEIVRERIGQLTVKEVFEISGTGTVGGCYVADGRVTNDSIVQVYRDEEQIFEGEISSLKRFQEDKKEVKEGYECGITIRNFNDLKVGDVIQAFEEEEVLRTAETV
jgi:translation initiation factor IF-2